MKCLLGIDVGTTGTKTLLFSADGQLLNSAYRSYESQHPHLGWSEQNPEDWWNGVVATVREVSGNAEVAGISLSLQGGTMVAVDKDFLPVRPAMVWNDTRCKAETEAYLLEVGSSIYQKTGWHLMPGLNAMQIRWLRENEPENFQKTVMFLSVPEYISYKMTGIPAVDPSDAGINQLYNIRERRYDPEILKFCGITEVQLPAVYQSGQVIGKLTKQAAEELGLSTETVLSAGAHDQYAVALGAGACSAGDFVIGSGTCWVVTCIGNAPDFASGLSQSVAAAPGLWGSLSELSAGGICLDWLNKNMGQYSYDRINEEVAWRKAAEAGLFFYPFSGFSQLQQKFDRASFIGLDLSHDKFHMARAVMEGVAFQICWMLEAFQTKPSPEGLILAGGAAKSPVWCQILADISGLPVRVPTVADLACVGAAILAGVGCGVFADARAGYAKLAVGERVIAPNPESTAMYQKAFAQYKHAAELLGMAYER